MQHKRKTEPIAIIGIGCRFADAADPESFFELLMNGIDATREVPENRWSLRSFYSADRRIPGKLSTARGGFLPQIDGFDAPFFGISPREAAYMDPQQRLMLEVSWEAMEDAGLVPEQLAGADVGVFAGAFTLDYKAIQLGRLNRHLIDAHTATGAMMTMISNRISYVFDFRGPSMSIDTACSSSLVAVHLACQSLRSGECSVALAGGVNVMVTPDYTIAESKGGFLAPDGRSKPFSASANGYGRAEGAGVVVLKPLAAALADGDSIYAVIRGSAVNQDGHTNGITVPSGVAQQRLIEEACRRSGVTAGQIQYVEAHGTGTPVGDPIEVNALAAALGKGRRPGDRCIIGSIKGNIGHAEAAAGVAGLIKTALCLKHRRIPPNLHFDHPNPAIPFAQLPLRVPKSPESWPDSHAEALAGVNSFGFGGTNAHVILEGVSTDTPDAGPERADTPVVFPLSARSRQALEAVAGSMRDFASNAKERGVRFADMFYSAAFRRSHHDHRLAVAAASNQELAAALDAYLRGESLSSCAAGTVPAERPRLVFVCTGMGPQWWAMGRQLFACEPVFRETILQCDEFFRKEADWSLTKEMMAGESQSRMAETQIAQTANFAIQTALAALWKSWGIEPDAVVGHSVGEVSAAYISGALSLRDAIRVSFHRSRLQQTTAGAGAMMAVGLPEGQARAWINPFEGRLSIAAVNSPSSTTVSGDPGAMERLAARLSEAGIFHRALRVDVAYHSAQMDPLRKELLDVLAGLSPRDATVPLYSTVTGGRVAGREFDAGYWWKNVREPVEFRRAVDCLATDGYNCFLEVGPHPVLASSIHECLSATASSASVLCSLRRGADERSTMLSALGSLYCTGMPVRWEAFRDPSARFIRLPGYPWQRERCWSESPESVEDRIGQPKHPLLGFRVSAARPTWECEMNPGVLPWLPDHAVRGAVVFPGAGYVEMAMAAGQEVFGQAICAIEDIRFERALFVKDDEYAKAQISVDPETATFVVHSGTNPAWVRNVSGRLAHASAGAAGKIELSEIESRCSTRMTAGECYTQFERQGFHYGPAFRKISRIATGDAEALAWFDNLGADEPGYQLHPTVLDACFQVLVATDPFRDPSSGESKTYLPTGIDRIVLRRQPSGRMMAWAHLDQKDPSGAKGSIFLCDPSGEVAVVIEGFEVKALDRAEGAMTQEHLQRSLYGVRWIPIETKPAHAQHPERERWLVFGDATGFTAELVHQLENAGIEAEVVRPGSEYAVSDQGCTIDPNVPEHFSRLFADIEDMSLRPVTRVIHCWSLDAGVDDLERAEEIGCVSLMHLFQAAAMSTCPPRVSIVTRGAQSLRPSDPVAVAQSAVWGLGRVAGHQEHLSLWGGLIDLDPATSSNEVDRVCAFVLAEPQEDQIAFRDDKCYAVRLDRSPDSGRALPAHLRPDAAYILTGGFGALGVLTAHWMVKQGARRLIMLGRSGVPERARWNDTGLDSAVRRRIAVIRDLEAAGAAIMTEAVDVADDEQLRDFIQRYSSSGYSPIRGVIHSAGLVDDRLMLQMDSESFRRVMRPKVRGALNLHNALAGTTLDFFVLYSSIGSIVAATGQANYASANAFLDALAHHRRSLGLPALSINWGPWATGMVAHLNLAEHYAERGMDVITPEQGMCFLGHLLAQDSAQIAVLSADWRRVFGFQAKVPPMLAHLADHSESADAQDAQDDQAVFLERLLVAEPADQAALLEEHVQSLTARVLRMDRAKIEVTESLSMLGLDSMMAMELKGRLELNLRVPVSVLDLLKGVGIADLSKALLEKVREQHSEILQMLAAA